MKYKNNIYKKTLSKISKFNITEGLVYEIFSRINNSHINNKVKEWKSMGIKILKILNEINPTCLYNVIRFKNDNFDNLIKSNQGKIKIYNEFYEKINKNIKK